MTHWTERSVDDFLYRIATDFVMQLENKIETGALNKAQLAQKLGVSKGRVSQILNNPGNLTLKMMIRVARALGMKIAIVAYDDDDYNNELGPINSEIFLKCWEYSGRPVDFWSLPQSRCEASTATLWADSIHFRQVQLLESTHIYQTFVNPDVEHCLVKLRLFPEVSGPFLNKPISSAEADVLTTDTVVMWQ